MYSQCEVTVSCQGQQMLKSQNNLDWQWHHLVQPSSQSRANFKMKSISKSLKVAWGFHPEVKVPQISWETVSVFGCALGEQLFSLQLIVNSLVTTFFHPLAGYLTGSVTVLCKLPFGSWVKGLDASLDWLRWLRPICSGTSCAFCVSSLLTIFMAFQWTFSSWSVSFLYLGAWTGWSTAGVVSQVSKRENNHFP